jgi:hypothetical protein
MTVQQAAWLGEDDLVDSAFQHDRLTLVLMPRWSFPQADLTSRAGCAIMILAVAVLLWL